MKTGISIVIIFSVLLNAALAAMLLSGSSNGKKIEPPAVGNAALSSSPSPANSTPEVNAEVWPSLQSEDLPTLIERLKAAGFPRGVIRAILGSQLGEAFLAKRRELDPDMETRPFWKNGQRDPKSTLALRQLGREHQKLMRDLLGNEDDDDSLGAIQMQARLGNIPPEKASQVRKIIEEFSQKQQDLFAGEFVYQVDQSKLYQIAKEQRAALAAVLSPQELEDYELRTSNVSDMLRYQLSAFNPTEQEFRAIYRLQLDFTDRMGGDIFGGAMNAEQMRQRQDAQKQLNEQIKALLTPERAAEYERANDYNYKTTSQLVARLELPPETTNQVWNVQKDIQQRIQGIMANSSLAPEQRLAQMTALNEETKTRITGLLGERGYQAYRQYGGNWMQILQRRPNRTP